MPRTSRSSFLIVTLATLVVASWSCGQWSEVRRDFVEPLNRFLHQSLPRAWKERDLDAILAHYDETIRDSEEVREEKRLLLLSLPYIDWSYIVIDSVEQLGSDDRARAHVVHRLHGTTRDGSRVGLEQSYEVVCERDSSSRWRIVAERPTDVSSIEKPEPAFHEEAASRGLSFEHESAGVLDKLGRTQDYSPGAGLAVGDYDGDGHDDVFLVGGAESKLFRNRGDGTFDEVAREAGLESPPRGVLWTPMVHHFVDPRGLWEEQGEGRCAVFADYDNDGHLDLFVGRIDAPDLLYRNRGDGSFDEVGDAAGIVPASGEFETTGALFADFDNDGWLDLYVVDGGNLLRKHPHPMYNALDATANRLYLSNRDGTFRDATEGSGVGHPGWALAVSASDYDVDGDVDIFVGNDVGWNVLYRNRGDATFENVTVDAGISYRGTSMSASWGDVNDDGFPDLFVAAMDSNSSWMLDQPGFPAPAPWILNLFIRSRVLDILREMLHGNRLYLSNGDGTFTEASTPARVRRNGWAWSSVFLDYDNDSDLDVYSINGFISGEKRDDL